MKTLISISLLLLIGSFLVAEPDNGTIEFTEKDLLGGWQNDGDIFMGSHLELGNINEVKKLVPYEYRSNSAVVGILVPKFAELAEELADFAIRVQFSGNGLLNMFFGDNEFAGIWEFNEGFVVIKPARDDSLWVIYLSQYMLPGDPTWCFNIYGGSLSTFDSDGLPITLVTAMQKEEQN